MADYQAATEIYIVKEPHYGDKMCCNIWLPEKKAGYTTEEFEQGDQRHELYVYGNLIYDLWPGGITNPQGIDG